MYAIGMMTMPAGFKYREVFLKGKPRHDRMDAFRIRHPKMDVGKRAKIFAPFDALRGFDFAIMCKNELYTDKVSLRTVQNHYRHLLERGCRGHADDLG